MFSVTLEPYEYERARQVGLERHLRAVSNSVHYEQFADDDDTSYDVNGALAEIAVAKALGLYWHGHGGALDRNSAFRYLCDVGENVEVRHVTKPYYGPMIRQADFEHAQRLQHEGRDLLIVAAYVKGARVDILGAIYVVDAWQDIGGGDCDRCKRFVDDGHLAIALCQSHLVDIDPYRIN